MRAVLLLLLACAPSGCDIVFHIDPITAGSGSSVVDANSPDDDGQVPPVCTLVGKNGRGGAGLIGYCVPTDSKGTIDVAGTFDTTANPMCDYQRSDGADMAPVCVLPAHVLTVTGNLVVTGDKPLVLAAIGTITITGSISVTAGANPGVCKTTGEGTAGDPSPNGTTGGGGGGGGGSWQTKGGKGGAGKSGTAALSGMVSSAVVEIRGGCPGGDGGVGITGTGGKAGNGGGAIYLTAGMAIHVSNTGSINASGRGGAGGIAPDGGAGAGGSGGLIAFDSPTVTFDVVSSPGAKLFANGGGGGAGGNATDGGVSTGPAAAGTGAPPNGGAGALAQGNGAAGVAATTTGGGGGGGGQGYLVLYTTGPLTVDPSHFSPNFIAGT